MDEGSDRLMAAVTETLDRELRIVREGVILVASGQSSRVVVGSLRFAEELFEQARPFAAGRGVSLTPLWGIDGRARSVAIEAGCGG